LVSGSTDKSIKVWDLRDYEAGKISATLSSSSSIVCSTLFEIGGNYFLAVGGSNSLEIEVWNLENNSLNYTLKSHHGGIWALTTYKSKEKTFLLSGNEDNTIKLWSISSKKCIHTFKRHYNSVWALDTNKKGGKSFLANGLG